MSMSDDEGKKLPRKHGSMSQRPVTWQDSDQLHSGLRIWAARNMPAIVENG